MPTWTFGRLDSRSSASSAEAKVAPWMPSRPVGAPTIRTTSPGAGLRQRQLLPLHDATHIALTNRVLGEARVEVDLAADVGTPMQLP